MFAEPLQVWGHSGAVYKFCCMGLDYTSISCPHMAPSVGLYHTPLPLLVLCTPVFVAAFFTVVSNYIGGEG